MLLLLKFGILFFFTPWLIDGEMLACFLNGAVSSALATSNNVNFCESGQNKSFVIGDFTGNGFNDFLCHSPTDGQLQLFNLRTAQILPLQQRFCVGGAKIVSADINGDFKDDLVCVNNDGTVAYLLNSETGGFFAATTGYIGSSFCKEDNDQKFITGDLNNDGKVDIICHHKSGYISYALSSGGNGPFNEIFETMVMNWCNGTNDQIIEGDFNNDGSVDLICHASGLYIESMLSFSSSTSEQNKFQTVQFDNIVEFCGSANSFVIAEDINGDGYQDLVCKTKTEIGTTQILLNRPNVYFTEQSVKYEFQFCARGSEKNFFVVDVNRDGKGDLICQTEPGQRYIFLSRCFS